MKTWQMIKELTENPHKKFKNKKVPFVIVTCNSINLLVDEEQNYINVPLGAEWEEVKEPVSFMEVLEHIEKSKTEALITIKHPQLNTLYSKVPFGWIVNRLFRDFKDDKSIVRILQTSEFYIE